MIFRAGANGFWVKEDHSINLIEAIRNMMEYNGIPISPAIARKTLQLLKGFDLQSSHKDCTTIENNILSRRESEILKLLLDYKQTGERPFISPAKVRTHIANIYYKIHVNSKMQVIRMAYKNTWI